MSVGLATLGVQCLNKAIGQATLGVICDATVRETEAGGWKKKKKDALRRWEEERYKRLVAALRKQMLEDQQKVTDIPLTDRQIAEVDFKLSNIEFDLPPATNNVIDEQFEEEMLVLMLTILNDD